MQSVAGFELPVMGDRGNRAFCRVPAPLQEEILHAQPVALVAMK